ncbi:MAG: calcium/proton exchanger [Desulfomonilaceae bacterium]
MLNWLLIFIPVTVLLELFAPERHSWIFITAAASIIPLAGWLGYATEDLASRTGEGVGGLLNATFGNAAELIIALAALHQGLHEVVKASIVGSILGNLLFVMGAAMLAGGLKFTEQRFNASATRSQNSMMTVAVVSLMIPAGYHATLKTPSDISEIYLAVAISVVLLACYGLNLVFALITHIHLFAGTSVGPDNHARWSLGRAMSVLAGATCLIAWMSEILVTALTPATQELGLNSTFVGLFVVAIVGNAAEHSTAIVAARKNRMDLSLSIAIGSSVQMALFVAPLLMLASNFIGPRPMDMAFDPGLVLFVFLAMLITFQVTGDGESNWLEGVQLLAVYLILSMVTFLGG